MTLWSKPMIEQLVANPYKEDGTKHLDMHLIYVEEICGLFKLAGLPGDEAMLRLELALVFPEEERVMQQV